ncbi:MAG TPA: glycosyltransferase family 39 protein, partial [Acetobacteraceae bacterium]|nr:glycosyltransferase family 39 protein [Acetobacteraceae bacterium]
MTAADRSAPVGGAVITLIAAGTAVRLLMAAAIGLGIDESYMVAAGRAFRLGYFDHPPISWWLATGAARLTGSEADVIVRLPFILLFALSTWLMYRLGAALFGARAGFWAALAFNLSPVFGVTTGGWLLPDGPLICALLAAAVCLLRALEGDGWGWWLGAGAAAGIALLSKYTAALTLLGALLYLATQPAHRRWLRRPQPYLAAVLACALFAPVIVWNATHGWASFAFQGGRAAERGVYPFGPLVVLAGEALFVLPWIWLPMMATAFAALRAGPADWRRWLPLCLGVPPILLFALVGLHSRHVLFHWAAPGYLMLFPLLGAALAAWPSGPVRRAALGTAALLLVGLALVASDVRWGWLPLHGDPGAQARDWTALRPALAARGLLHRPDTVIGA